MGKTSEEIVENYRPRIEEWLKYAYSEGYSAGRKEGNAEVERLRSESHLEAGEKDDEYADGWGDYTRFYGWCSQCHHPISGRWAHIAEYCNWCGARLNRDNEPYPAGMRHKSELMKRLTELCEDINPDEIMAHESDDSLISWCNAWHRALDKIVKEIGDGEV